MLSAGDVAVSADTVGVGPIVDDFDGAILTAPNDDSAFVVVFVAGDVHALEGSRDSEDRHFPDLGEDRSDAGVAPVAVMVQLLDCLEFWCREFRHLSLLCCC